MESTNGLPNSQRFSQSEQKHTHNGDPEANSSSRSEESDIEEVSLDEVVSVNLDYSQELEANEMNDIDQEDNLADADDFDGEDDNEEQDDGEEDDQYNWEDEDADDPDGYDEYNETHDGPPYGSFLFRDILQRTGGGNATDSNILDVMQRLVSGMEGSPFERQLSEYDHLIDNLVQRDDVYLIMETLNELLERLLMMNGITAERVISPNKLAKALVGILSDPRLLDDLELHLVACRCLYNFIEVNQDFIHDALNSDAIEVLVKSLLEITYIDLTEQALQTLEMMSREPGSHSLIITSSGLKACLENLDFLTIHAQRKCLTIVANACTNILTAHFQMVLDEFEKLAAVAENHTDNVVLENTWLAISRIIISYRMRPDFLERLFLNEGILFQMASVICSSCNPTNTELGLKYNSNISLIKSLITVASSSVRISLLLLKIRIGKFIGISLNKFKRADDPKNRLSKERAELEHLEAEPVSIEALIAAPKELLSNYLHLIGYLLPITYTLDESPFFGPYHKDHEVKTRINLERASLYRNEFAKEYIMFVNDVWSVLIRSFQATVDYEIRRNVLINMTRIISFNEGENFSSIHGVEDLTGVLTAIVASGSKRLLSSDPQSFAKHDLRQGSLRQDLLLSSLILLALKMLQKSNNSWSSHFEKEGFFNDLLDILKFLSSAFPELDYLNSTSEQGSEASETSDRRAMVNMASAFHNKYVDKELINEEEVRSSTDDIYKKLRLACHRLENVYHEIQNLSIATKNLFGTLSEILSQLDLLIQSLNASSEQWSSTWIKLRSLLESDSNPVSTFELISLGMTRKICEVFDDEIESYHFSTSPRSVSFMNVFHAYPNTLARFVELLQKSLTRTESFEIISSGGHSSNGGGNASVMTKQVKLKLVPANEIQPLNLQLFTLSVHSIATFKSVESFLIQKFMFLDQIHGADREVTPFAGVESTGDSDESTQVRNGIEFSIDGHIIPIDTTIYGAIYQAIQSKNLTSKVDPHDIWSSPHTVSFQRVKVPETRELSSVKSPLEGSFEPLEASTASILKLLKILFTFNQHVESGTLAESNLEIFMNWKLTVKLNRQLEEPLIIASGTLPNWSIILTRDYPFLFPLETRMLFLQSTSFGYSRLIHNWQLKATQEQRFDDQIRTSLGNNHLGGLQLGRPLRRKVRISRRHILQSALKVLQLYGSSPGVLEIEYFDEVGSGLGPTLEFYSSVSREFHRSSLRMWRDDATYGIENEYVMCSKGLFPKPMDKGQIESENGKKVLFLFSALGMFVARSLIDSRIVDFSFNTQFLRLIQNTNLDKSRLCHTEEDISNSISLIREIDPGLASSLEHLCQYLRPGLTESHEIEDLSIDDLSLSFVLPGYSKYELIPNGANVAVNATNLRHYIALVVEATISGGVMYQVQAFMQGFSKVFPISSLAIFSPLELNAIFGNSDEDWSKDTLTEAMKANHGYSRDSLAIHRLINVLSSFSELERRKFLQFLTGSPKLPIGGFKAIKPEFTVVKKRAEDGLRADDYLPSVMTCANYLKIPDYSLEIVMKEKLLRAITEGAGAFHLS